MLLVERLAAVDSCAAVRTVTIVTNLECYIKTIIIVRYLPTAVL